MRRACVFNRRYSKAWTRSVRRVVLTFCQADVVVPMATYSLHIDLCVTYKCLVSNFQKCRTGLYQSGPGVSHQGLLKEYVMRWSYTMCCFVCANSGCAEPMRILFSRFMKLQRYNLSTLWQRTRPSNSSELLWAEMFRHDAALAVLCASTWKRLLLV